MPSVARLGDTISCTDVIAEGSGNVFAEGMPVSRIDQDFTLGHCFNPVKLVVDPSINKSTVFVNNKPIAIQGDFIDHPAHFCISPPVLHTNPPIPPIIAIGAATVFAYG